MNERTPGWEPEQPVLRPPWLAGSDLDPSLVAQSLAGMLEWHVFTAASFGVPLISLLRLTPVTWEPAACPLCRAGGKPEHPGS